MIKAIETRYNGYRFRSRLEARWAVFFNTVGIKYHYEHEGYKLNNGPDETIWYLPDFWLPDLDTLIEIKPTFPTELELRKMVMLCQQIRKSCYILCGTVGFTELRVTMNPNNFTWNLLDGYLAIDCSPDGLLTQSPSRKIPAYPITTYTIPLDMTMCTAIFAEVDGNMNLHPFSIREVKKEDQIHSLPTINKATEELKIIIENLLEKQGTVYISPFYPDKLKPLLDHPDIVINRDTVELKRAYITARQARFEHGAKGH